MDQIQKSKAEIKADILELADMPISAEISGRLVSYVDIYDALCRAACLKHGDGAAQADEDKPHFSREMAMAWTSDMINADGSKGPHWTMEQTNKTMEDHKVDCDPVLWWAVMNSLYSDYCEALKKNNASTVEVYVCLAKAWINDKDAVADKAAAYYTNIVQH